MKKSSIVFLILALVLCFALPAGATTLFLTDWGVSPGTWAPTSAPSNSNYTEEAYTGSNPNGELTPGWGGYSFDAKASYIAFDGTKTYLAVVTGLPQTGAKDIWRYNNDTYYWNDWNQSLEKYWYMPGSLAIDIGNDGSHEFAVTTRVDSTGATYAPTPGEGMLVSKNLVFEDPKAYDKYDQYTDWGGVSDPWAAVGYDTITDLGVNFSYSYFGDVTTGAGTFATYAIEAIIDNSLLGLGLGEGLALHWTMECGNDAIDIAGTAPIPEPGTMLLLGSGMAGLAFYRRRFSK